MIPGKLYLIFCRVFIFLMLINVISLASDRSASGNLIIIGGGSRPDYMMNKIFELAGGAQAQVLIIPNASYDPIEAGEYYVEEFSKYNLARVEYLALTPETVDALESLQMLDGVTGVYFSGGDQSRLTDLMAGSKLLEGLRELYRAGAVISGTSAGAAIMSEIMITGNERVSQDTVYAFSSIQADNIEHVTGFALVTEAIIDQHHIRRKRHNRLISLVMENPELIGLGIDESTAIWVKPDRTFEVIGESAVLVYDARSADVIQAEDGKFHCRNMEFHILLHGDKFDMKN